MQRALVSLVAGSLVVSLSAAVAAAPLPPKPVTATLLKHPGSAGGAGGVSAGNVAAAGVGAMSSGGVGGVGGAGAYPGAKVNRPGPSVIWYPPEYSAKKQHRADQSCQWLDQKAKVTGTRYWHSRYNNCIATR